jgi:hypothetical protein
MSFIICFIIGFSLGISYRYRYKIVDWFAYKYYSVWAAVYYRPKIRRCRKFIERRGWKQTGYDEFAEWSHPEKGTKYFYSAVCLEAGKKVRI